MKLPRVSMSPEAMPVQRLVAVAVLSDRPKPFDSAVGWGEKPDGVLLPNGPSKADYLGQVEWSWSPMHNRVDAYYLSRSRTHWILWLYSYDDNWEKWDWLAIGHVPLRQSTCKTAAVHLLADFWQMEKKASGLDHYHWINEDGSLDASQWRTIALQVWPEIVLQKLFENTFAD